jgi:hypothetical protein
MSCVPASTVVLLGTILGINKLQHHMRYTTDGFNVNTHENHEYVAAKPCRLMICHYQSFIDGYAQGIGMVLKPGKANVYQTFSSHFQYIPF